MANNNKLTIFQRLNKVLGNEIEGPKYIIDQNSFKNLSDSDLEQKKLEAQQTLYLQNQWKKIDNELYQKAVYYEPTRLSSFYDYESMEYTPELSAALDAYAEESTTVDEDGYMLQIYSESKRIKSILTDLFNNILDINTNLPMWTRNTCKYGDNFVYLKLDPEKGVVGCFQLPNIEMERIERGMTPHTVATAENEQKALKFAWKNKQMEYQSWEIAHFRLLGDDRRLPYGTSMLEKARRTWKQLVLAEDAMLIYRTSRAPERRVFKVYVGNMDDKDVQPYVQKFANNFKRDQVVDSKSGNVDMRYNQMAVDQDYFVPVRDPSAPNPIDTLPGAQNLAEIADIEYIQKKLLTALRIPKAFLGFEETVGDGKNLSLLDIRFARTINRIQKSMIAELNKIAIVHLFLLGFEDELGNFTLGLTNPSKQADLLAIDVYKEKLLAYKDSTTPIEGIAPTSQSWAKKHILGFSDEEIKLDLQQQRLERAIAAELTNTPTIISKTGIFDNVDKLYGSISGQTGGAVPTPGSELGGGGGEFGGPPPELGGGAELGGAPPEIGGAPEAGAPPPPPEGETVPEGRMDKINILLEGDFLTPNDFLDLGKAKHSLNQIDDELGRLLNS